MSSHQIFTKSFLHLFCRNQSHSYVQLCFILNFFPDNKVHGANMGPTWVLSAPDGPHVGPINLAIRVDYFWAFNFIQGPFKCEKCVKEFPRWKQLQRHLRSHEDDKPFCCPECPLTFNVEENLVLHKATHQTDNPVCPECGKKFARIASLKAHIMMHEKEESLMCAECGDEFSLQVKMDYCKKDVTPGDCFTNISRGLSRYSLKICVLQKSYFLWEFQAEASYVCQKPCFWHLYKIWAWNSHHKCDFWHCLFLKSYFGEQAKR